MPEITSRLSVALADRYRIERRLGEGGMATVYLAEDLKHDRKVALKVLKPELAAVLGAERFVQEIKTTASLQHPNILPLFDSGEADAFLYYVMPFIDGETLREKLDRETQLDVDEAVRITTDVADALDYAHRQGVIHRDIKPENVLLHDGRPMVADFGIALAVSAAAGGRMTETGLSLGTPHYMSPEQATAEKRLTNRSDVYSLGAVLYEMLAGEPPHTGASAQAIVMKIVTEDARPITELRKSVPPNVAAATAKALEKLPADRFATASAFAGALADSSFVAAHVAAQRAEARASRPRLPLAVGWLASLGVVAVATWMLTDRGSDPSRDVSPRFNINLDRAPMAFIGEASLGLGRRNLAISRDGSMIAYIGVEGGEGHLFVRRIDEYVPRRLPRTAGAYSPFFSPNGKYLGFFVANELQKVAVDGGDPIVLAAVANPMGGVWGDEDRIIFAGREGLDILGVSPDGGDVQLLFKADGATSTVAGAKFPSLLPGGETVLATGWNGETYVITLPTGPGNVFRARATDARYVGAGVIVYVSGSSLLASRFDETSLALVGQSVPVLDNVRSEIGGVGQWDVSSTGDLVYAPGGAVAEGTLAWLASDGTLMESLGVSVRRHGTFELSPDGTRLAIEVLGTNNGVWMYDLTTGAEQQLSATGSAPNWSGDGTQVLFQRREEGGRTTYLRTVDAGTEAERLAAVPAGYVVFSWSRDGAYVAVSFGTVTGRELAALELATGELTPIHASEANNWGTAFSPDGRAVAYTSDETGEYHVYVAPFPPTGLRKTASREGGAEEPVWAPSGDRLYYRNGQRLMSVSVRWTPELELGPPTVQFERDWANVGGRSYDVSRDGRRFLVILPEASTASTLNVVVDWLAEVRRRLSDGP